LAAKAARADGEHADYYNDDQDNAEEEALHEGSVARRLICGYVAGVLTALWKQALPCLVCRARGGRRRRVPGAQGGPARLPVPELRIAGGGPGQRARGDGWGGGGGRRRGRGG